MKRVTLISLIAITNAFLFLSGSNCGYVECVELSNTSKQECEAQTVLQGGCVWQTDATDTTGKKGVCGTKPLPPPPSPEASSACTATGDITKFQVTCTKNISQICIGGSICAGNGINMNGIYITKIDGTHVEGTALGQTALTFTLKHSDGTISKILI